jgi:anti-anti-sigma factor
MRWPAVTPEGGDCTFYVTADDANPGVFHLHGELDLACADVLDELPVAFRLDQPVVLDLTEVTFCDSVGLTGLLKVRRRVVNSQGHLVLRRPNSTIERMLEIAGLTPVLPVAD